MSKYRFVSPETARIEIGDGDHVVVKQRLTVGEFHRARRLADDVGSSVAFVAIYLVDWSFVDEKGVSVELGETDAEKAAAVNNLSLEDFNALDVAIGKHAKAVSAVEDTKKKTLKRAPSGGTTPAAA